MKLMAYLSLAKGVGQVNGFCEKTKVVRKREETDGSGRKCLAVDMVILSGIVVKSDPFFDQMTVDMVYQRMVTFLMCQPVRKNSL